MSSCLSGGRAYRLELIRSPSTSWTSHSSSSPSPTLSESSNSPVAITTRKPRTPRKRPNQTYNEAATILSTAYPKVFPHKQLRVPRNFGKTCNPFAYEVQDCLLPFQIQLHHPSRIHKPNIGNESKVVNSIEKFFEYGDEYREDFDAESLLDEETEEGIDSILGDIGEDNNESMEEYKNTQFFTTQILNMNTCYGYPVGMEHYGNYSNFGDNYGYGLRREAFRGNDQFDYWGFSSVNVADITPEFNKSDKKKKKKVDKSVELFKKSNNLITKKVEKEDVINLKKNGGLLLKLDYENVLNAWSDRSTPLPEELLSSEDSANDVQMRLSKIDLFTEGGGIREASVMRYKEKRQTRHFSKKIRYQVRKANADQRPRMKGRFVRSPESPGDEHR